ncbi:MAG: 30S ribosomal protein S2 [Candidatus Colwellbacteria bacterium]|nr:30S ribosomal protein S2 [Candidatus Colwellbacteria bacterium]
MTTIQEEIKETPKTEQQESLTTEEILLLQEMVEAGLSYGLAKSKTHPGMKPYIFMTRSGVEIINLESSIKLLSKAAEFLKSIVSSGKSVLIVGTAPAAKNAVKDVSSRVGTPFVSERWLGGTITNFKVISSRIKHFNKLIADRESGAFGKYTKKERVLLDKKIEKMRLLFEGLSSISDLPGALIVLDPQENEIAIAEAKELGIPVVALANTDINPKKADYIIPGNNRLAKSVEWVLSYLEPFIKKTGVEKKSE